MKYMITFMTALMITACGQLDAPLTLPAVFTIDSNVPDSKISILQEAATIWNKAVGVNVFQIEEYPKDITYNFEDDINGIFWVIDFKTITDKEGAVGHAKSLRTKSGKLTDNIKCDVSLRADTFGTCVMKPDGSIVCGDLGDTALLATMIHELGHCAGLNHSKNKYSIMYHEGDYGARSGLDKDALLSQEDINNMRKSLRLDLDGGASGD